MDPVLPEFSEHLERAARLLRTARLAIAVTGAGISVPSGIPDFRSPGGLWSKHAPEEVATYAALRQQPKRVWEFLLDANKLLSVSRPNPAHIALAELEAAGRLAAVITQNIDGLHQLAGSKTVIEFHGSARRYSCMGCNTEHDAAEAALLTRDQLPWTCERCGGVVRPDIVFFGEHIPAPALSESLALAKAADCCLVVGTSGEVAPANTLPKMVADHGGTVIEINLGPSAYGELLPGGPDITLRANCEVVLPELVKRV